MINDTITHTLTAYEQRIIELLSSGTRYTKQDMAKHIGKSLSTINRIISNLTNKNLIERIGSNKTGHWKIKA